MLGGEARMRRHLDSAQLECRKRMRLAWLVSGELTSAWARPTDGGKLRGA
jgi:hypothetical protein